MIDVPTKKVRLALDTDVLPVLAVLAGGPRKQGKYVSRLIRQAAQVSKHERIAQLREELAELEKQG